MFKEYEIAKQLIDGYNLFKDDKNFVAIYTNLERPEYKECDFSIVEKFLKRMNYKMKIEYIDGYKSIKVEPINP